MTDTTQNTRILLASRPHGEPTAENFRLETVPMPEPAEGEVLLRTIYLSLDPYMRGRMSDAKSYAAPVEVGAVMQGGTVAQVVQSRDPSLAEGDIVLSHLGWQAYGVQPARQVRKLDPQRAPISTAVGVLGMPGFTAYAGLLEIGRPQPGETVVVAAAAGPVGSAVGQIARIKGARAVGIAGGPEKVAWLEELGFDVALDHRSPTFKDDLKAAVPDGIDVYFENVGGHVWDAVLPRLNTYARVPVCGLVAHYNETEAPAGPDRMPRLMQAILTKSLTIRGFIQTEFVKTHYKEFQKDAAGWLADGSLRHREDVVEGLENAPEAFFGLLTGKNFGKLLVQVSDDPTR
ncbi:zinc-binding dehydrogenase [Aeromicrobium sp. SMF47]|uniref:NADP-dependent oxidoreductase n=1 Tax=Aeromicrobium yanjiei TaxID=2662028 RepID=UPI00129EC4DE|nr:NADP-dependent oxidoreductase [Aeromicrobium yanjiei]MRJ75971.1 zinc-binding dehydrogenase [Aeromicrobium yanjiei]